MPSSPKVCNRLCNVGIVKVFKKLESHHITKTTSHIGVTREIKVNLECIGYHSAQTQSNKNLERINKLLEDIENKNKKYNWSIETMENQMKQLEVLTSMLKVILENNGKEESHE